MGRYLYKLLSYSLFWDENEWEDIYINYYLWISQIVLKLMLLTHVCKQEFPQEKELVQQCLMMTMIR